MAFRVNGREIANDDGDLTGKLGKNTVESLDDGVTAELSPDDEIPILEQDSAVIKRFTIQEIADSGLLSNVESLDSIGDVDAPTPALGQVIAYNSVSGNYEASTPLGVSIAADVAPTTRPDGSPLQDGDIYFSTLDLQQFTWYTDANSSQWVESTAAPAIQKLADLPDVDAAAPGDGEVLSYNATSGNWESASPTGGSGSVASLDDIGDVSLPTPSANQVLVYDGSQWVADSITSISANGNGALLTADWTQTGAGIPFPGTFRDFSSGRFLFSVLDGSSTDRTTEFASLAIGETVNITFSNGTTFTGDYNGILSEVNGNYAEFNNNNGALTGSISPSATYTVTFTTQAGNVLVGNQTIDGSLTVKGNLSVTDGGVITGDGSGITNVSDTRWKTGISTIGIGMTFIDQINPIKFQYQRPVAGIDTTNTESLPKWDYSEGWVVSDDHWRYGFSAQEIAAVEASMGADHAVVVDDNPEQLQLRPEGLMPIMVNALKELKAEIAELRTTNESLQTQIDALSN